MNANDGGQEKDGGSAEKLVSQTSDRNWKQGHDGEESMEGKKVDKSGSTKFDKTIKTNVSLSSNSNDILGGPPMQSIKAESIFALNRG